MVRNAYARQFYDHTRRLHNKFQVHVHAMCVYVFTYHQFACDESINPIKSQMVTTMRISSEEDDDDSITDRRPLNGAVAVDAARVTAAGSMMMVVMLMVLAVMKMAVSRQRRLGGATGLN